jgi:stringent starvation protein B
VTFAGRFGGIPSNIVVPIGAVIGIFAKETGQGLLFQPEEITPPEPDSEISTKPVAKRPVLKIVK